MKKQRSSKPDHSQFCYICGKSGTDSMDHIPPRNLFSKISKGQQLLTVPTHFVCQKLYSTSDEILREYIALEASYKTSSGHRAWKDLVAIAKRRSYIKKRILKTFSPIKNSDGRDITHQNSEIIESQVQRWIRALFYKKFGEILPLDHKIEAMKLRSVSDGISAIIQIFREKAGQPKWYAVEPPVLRFAYEIASDDFHKLIAVFIFHEAIAYAGWTNKIEDQHTDIKETAE